MSLLQRLGETKTMAGDNKSALIAMSRGVDSSVAAYLMKYQGYRCMGITMRLYRNSELGIIQPVKEISQIVKAKPNCRLHVDATQAIGKIPFSYEGFDTVSLAAHKFYGELFDL